MNLANLLDSKFSRNQSSSSSHLPKTIINVLLVLVLTTVDGCISPFNAFSLLSSRTLCAQSFHPPSPVSVSA
ncbi:hypothetical protein BJY52DRAFT_1219511 [Lactarius psammicola]|nr:hypothetical protein BJY52DRAFT_1219511 [Lactarius psammicola]